MVRSITRSSMAALGECRHTAASCPPTQSGELLHICELSRFRRIFQLSRGSRVFPQGPHRRESKHPTGSNSAGVFCLSSSPGKRTIFVGFWPQAFRERHSYKKYEGTQLWRALDKGIGDLVQNQDLI